MRATCSTRKASPHRKPVDVGTFDGTHGFGDGRSPWGIHDMAGNISELVSDCAGLPTCTGDCRDPHIGPASDAYCDSHPKGGSSSNRPAAIRSWGENSDLMSTDADWPGGFRCVSDGK